MKMPSQLRHFNKNGGWEVGARGEVGEWACEGVLRDYELQGFLSGEEH